VWSSAIPIRPAFLGEGFSVWFDGTYFHYVYAYDSPLYYRRGTPNSDGTITWSADEQTVPTTYNGKVWCPFVSVDTDGYAWIGYGESEVNYSPLPFVTKSGNNDGTWGTTPTGFPFQLSATVAGSWVVSVIPLTAGKMLAIYHYHDERIRMRAWTGSAWKGELKTPSRCYSHYSFSAVPQGDSVHIAFPHITDYNILHVKYTYATNSLSSQHTVIASTTNKTKPVLAIDSDQLYCFWATKTTDSPAGAIANHIYYQTSKDGGVTWSPIRDWIDESTERLTLVPELMSFVQSYNNYLGLVYATKESGLHNVKFRYLRKIHKHNSPHSAL